MKDDLKKNEDDIKKNIKIHSDGWDSGKIMVVDKMHTPDSYCSKNRETKLKSKNLI